MLGTVVNSVSILIGSLLGYFLKNSFSEDIKSTVMQGLSLTVMLIGISMSIKTNNLLVVTLSIVTGAIIGESLKIEEGLNKIGGRIEKKFSKTEGEFTKAFVTASLVYCVGAMAIMGSIESGLSGNHSILFVKSILDGVSSIVFTSSLGIGVAFSSLPVFIYQGAITLSARFIKAYLTQEIIREMTATGGLLIFGIGINMLSGKSRVKVGNFLPAIFTAIFITYLFMKYNFY
ncbi:DUF554 domain-containing protein [Thermovenabulum gondwanense]|uniref:Putative membrane protein YdfK n=1 Tax=Thermovenabulum gondwanense TaxID=520767 RepID=A0A162MSL8_9FIRM|nr:DUF554 domain-containing protein [Thermovenabulum gondwanense]KYO67235.1 putative membrane protein YdfK [Thermovenabulum gondwanense]